MTLQTSLLISSSQLFGALGEVGYGTFFVAASQLFLPSIRIRHFDNFHIQTLKKNFAQKVFYISKNNNVFDTKAKIFLKPNQDRKCKKKKNM